MIKQWFYTRSISRKLHVLLMIGCIISIACFSTAYIYLGVHALEKRLMHETETAARSVGSRLGTALQFMNASFAAKRLEAHGAEHAYKSICVYNTEGAIFASYPPQSGCPTIRLLPDGSFKEIKLETQDHIEVTRNILVNGEIVGAISLARSTAEIGEYIASQIKTMLLVAVLCLVICYFVANYLQKIISAPILELAKNAKDLVALNTPSTQLSMKQSDEISQVVEAFNSALRLMHAKYVSLGSAYHDTSRAYSEVIKKLDMISDEFEETMDSFIIFSNMTTGEMIGKEVKNYIEYQSDVMNALGFYKVKMDSLRQLSSIYAKSIEEQVVNVDIARYISQFADNLSREIPFIPIAKEGLLANAESQVIMSLHKLAWDELFTLIRGLYSMLSGVTTFSAKITFDITADSSHLLMIFGDSEKVRAMPEAASQQAYSCEIDEMPFVRGSIEDPNVASEFLDEELLQRQDLKYIIDSIAYIANANEINLSHRFSNRRFVLEMDISARVEVLRDASYLAVH